MNNSNANTDSQHRTGDPTGWGVVSACVMQSDKLSMELRGVLSIIATLPPNWSFHFRWLRARTGWGRDKLQRVMREARECGFVIWETHSRGHGSIHGAYVWRNAREWEAIVPTVPRKPRQSRLPEDTSDEKSGTISKGSTPQSKPVSNPISPSSTYADEIADAARQTSSEIGVGVDVNDRLRIEKNMGKTVGATASVAHDGALPKIQPNQTQNPGAPIILDFDTFYDLQHTCQELDVSIEGAQNRGRMRALYEACDHNVEDFAGALEYGLSYCEGEGEDAIWSKAIMWARYTRVEWKADAPAKTDRALTLVSPTMPSRPSVFDVFNLLPSPVEAVTPTPPTIDWKIQMRSHRDPVCWKCRGDGVIPIDPEHPERGYKRCDALDQCPPQTEAYRQAASA